MTAQYAQSTFTANGLETHYLHAGAPDAPLLVLLHEGAFGASAEASWGPLIPILAEEYLVIAPDLYGYGASSKVAQFDASPYALRLHQLSALLADRGLGDASAHLVGNSFGGAMALRAAVTEWFAPRVRSVVSFGGTGGPFRTAEGMDHLGRFDGTPADMARLVRFANGEFPGLDEHVAIRMAGVSAGNYRAILAPMMPAPFTPAPAPDAYPESLAETSVPIVAVEGLDDPFVEQGWAQKIAQHAPFGRALVINGGHSPNVTDPGETARLILGVLHENEQVLTRASRTEEEDGE